MTGRIFCLVAIVVAAAAGSASAAPPRAKPPIVGHPAPFVLPPAPRCTSDNPPPGQRPCALVRTR